jgi:hypothetical protein
MARSAGNTIERNEWPDEDRRLRPVDRWSWFWWLLWLVAFVVAISVLSTRLGAQQETRVSERPTGQRLSVVRLVDGSNNNTHICYGPQYLTSAKAWSIASGLTEIVVASNVATVTATGHGIPATKVGAMVTVSGGLEADTWPAADITSIVDAANTSTITFDAAHGLDTNDLITIAGITTDTDLNGTYAFTNTGAATGTVTTANVTDQTYNEASDPTMQIGLGDADANGNYIIQSVADANTFTLTFASVPDGDLNEYASLTVTMTQPRPPLTDDVVWDVKRRWFSGTNLIAEGWAVAILSGGERVRRQKFVCDATAAVVYH